MAIASFSPMLVSFLAALPSVDFPFPFR